MCPRRTSTVLTGINVATLGLGGVFNGIPRVGQMCGNYTLTDANGNTVVTGGGRFGTSETNSFCIAGGVPQLYLNDNENYARQIPNPPENTTFRLYPNPTDDILNIQFDGNPTTDIQINIVDMMGKIIHTEIRATFNSNIQLNLNNLNSGIYFIQIIDNEKMMSEKFVAK